MYRNARTSSHVAGLNTQTTSGARALPPRRALRKTCVFGLALGALSVAGDVGPGPRLCLGVPASPAAPASDSSSFPLCRVASRHCTRLTVPRPE